MSTLNSFIKWNRLTEEPESDWNMTGIPPPSSSDHLFLCTGTQTHTCCVECWIIYCANRHELEDGVSPFVLSFLICVHVLQLVQLWVEDCDVCLSLQQGRPQLLIFLRGHLVKNRNNLHVSYACKTVPSKMTYMWEIADLLVQSGHLLSWLV